MTRGERIELLRAAARFAEQDARDSETSAALLRALPPGQAVSDMLRNVEARAGEQWAQYEHHLRCLQAEEAAATAAEAGSTV